jgi:tRNA nucleotidyltransferase/poly(A) polymerase
VPTVVRRYVRTLGLDAYLVGGAVRDELLGLPHSDEDFLVPGVDHAGLRALLEPHGRVEDLEVHGQLVGVRLHPRDPAVRGLVPAGIELTPPRAERSTGPGHRDFEIVSDREIGVEEDMGRRDFTINAIARHLATGELVDPFGGVGDLARRELRTVSPQSFREDPLRLVRGLRLVSQLGFTLTGETVAEMRLEAQGLRHVSAERIGGGLAADGLGELSKLLLGVRPRAALELARETGVLAELLPELVPAIGYRLASDRQPLPLDEHILAVVQHTADHGAPLAVRLAALLHDSGKPEADKTGASHAEVGARVASRVLRRLRYPVRMRRRVERIVRHHSFRLDGGIDGRFARRFLAEHGDAAAFDLVSLKEADLAAKRVPESELEAVAALRSALEAEHDSPHRLADLAVGGADLQALGFHEGPELGRVLHALLAAVVDDPARNEREWLLERARMELP